MDTGATASVIPMHVVVRLLQQYEDAKKAGDTTPSPIFQIFRWDPVIPFTGVFGTDNCLYGVGIEVAFKNRETGKRSISLPCFFRILGTMSLLVGAPVLDQYGWDSYDYQFRHWVRRENARRDGISGILPLDRPFVF